MMTKTRLYEELNRRHRRREMIATLIIYALLLGLAAFLMWPWIQGAMA